MKTNKAFTDRLKVTRNGKIVARKPGQNHYNAMEDRRTKTRKNRTQTFSMTKRAIRRFLPGTK